LCPSLNEDERKKIESMREDQRKSMISLDDTLKDGDNNPFAGAGGGDDDDED